MKFSELKRVYSNLNLIIHKKNYLIPNKPKLPSNPYVKFSHEIGRDLRFRIQLQNPNIKGPQKWKTYHNILKQKIKENDPIYAKIKAEYDQQFAKYLINKDQYQRLYIDPPKLNYKYRPFFFFSHQISEANKKQNKKTYIKQIANQWQKLNNEQRQQIIKRCNQQKLKHLQNYKQYIENHKIPIVKSPNGLNVFVSEQISMRIQNDEKFSQKQDSEQEVDANQKIVNINSPQMIQKYQKLSLDQKQRYIKLAKTRRQISEKLYQSFLQKWHISHQDLQHIRKICQLYNQQSKALRQTKKNMKSTQLDQLSEQLDPQQQEQMLLQQNEVQDKVQKPRKKSTSKKLK